MADNGAHCVETIHSTPGLKVVTFKPDFQSDTVRNRDGSLQWKNEGDRLMVTDKQDQPVYTSSSKATLNWWTRGGFVVTDEEGSHCYSREGKLLGDTPAIMMSIGASDFAMEGVGYGGPSKIFDLGTGKLLGKLAYAAGPSYPPDASRLAVCTDKGLLVLVLDVAASLKEQRLVALNQDLPLVD